MRKLIAPLAPAFALLSACMGWIFVYPLTLLIPRDPGLALFFGRDGGKFVDNCKHLFTAFQREPVAGVRAVYLVRDHELQATLKKFGAESELVSSLAGWWLRLRAGTFIVDSIDWSKGMGFCASRGSRVVQLWHGVPLKQVQIPLLQSRIQRLPGIIGYLLKMQRAIIGRFARSAWMLSTSPWITDHAFGPSFQFDRISHAGYPRNDALFFPQGLLSDLGTDEQAAREILQFRTDRPSGSVGVYAPTFRDALNDPFASGHIDLQALSDIACRNDVLLLVKLHPWMHGRVAGDPRPGIVFVAAESDLYPLLREVDFLVTDYSSIFFDFLLLDRPVIFFPYDLDHYLRSERPMYFDYSEMTPGPKAFNMNSLAHSMANIGADDIIWRDERKRVRDLVFLHQDGAAAQRLLTELFPTSRQS